MSSTSGVFSAPNVDLVPYQVAALDAAGNVIAVPAGVVISLVSATPNAIVVPNSTDPTGASGNIVAAAGFTGPVNGTATLTNADGTVANGTWSGTFNPEVDDIVNLSVTFGTPTAPAATAGPSADAQTKKA